MKKILMAAFVLALVYSCSNTKKTAGANTVKTEKPAPPPPPPAAPVINTTIDSIKIVTASVPDGKATFTAKCGRCHRLYDPAEFTAKDWQPIVTGMAIKARLNETEKANVMAYVKDGAKKG